MMQQLAAIVLAAGFSRRMGSENKLLKPLGGRPLLSYALQTIGSLGLGQVLVVAGERADEIAPMLPGGANLLRNPDAAEGMGRSIACGAAMLDESLGGVFIVLGDMPFVERGDFEKLAAALAGPHEAAVCIPLHEGRRGHPVLFERTHFTQLATLSGDYGARQLIASGRLPVAEVEGCSPGVLTDLDDAAAFAAAEARFHVSGPLG